MKDIIGLGVAGNFAHHLQQAKELEEFKDIETKEEKAPKGIFPFYIPNSNSFLGICSMSNNELILPKDENVQVEPEIVIMFDIVYSDFKVVDLVAKKFTTFNDTTIRKEGVPKISLKKSWGESSKGIAKKFIDIDKFEDGGVMDNYNLCSYLKRDGILYEYGVDAPLLGYSYFYTKLKEWLIDKINNQKAINPLEDMQEIFKEAKYPKQVLITIGATAYSDFGEKNFLKPKDEVFVVAYHNKKDKPDLKESDTKIVLHQIVS